MSPETQSSLQYIFSSLESVSPGCKIVAYDCGVDVGKRIVKEGIVSGKNITQFIANLISFLKKEKILDCKEKFVSDIIISLDVKQAYNTVPVEKNITSSNQFIKGLIAGAFQQFTGKRIVITHTRDKKNKSFTLNINIVNPYFSILNKSNFDQSIANNEINCELFLEMSFLSLLATDTTMIEKVYEAGKIFAQQLYFSSGEKVETDISVFSSKKKGLSKEPIFTYLKNVFSEFGLGTLSLLSLGSEDKTIILKLKGSPFSKRSAKSGKPLCFFINGVFSGYFSLSFGQQVASFETKCRGLGDSYCEFLVKVMD